MWYNYSNRECFVFNVECQGCSEYWNYWNRINNVQQFNYECPGCHGKFNIPAYRYAVQQDGLSGYFNYCPFCNRIMEGL